MDILTHGIVVGIFSGIISNLLVLLWFGKNVPIFFQNNAINKDSDIVSIYISVIFTAVIYTIIVLLFNWYIVLIDNKNNILFVEYIVTIDRLKMFVEVFLLSFLFLGGRSLLYGKIVLNLSNDKLKVIGYD